MADSPIIFSAPMVLALLDGRKTMTRRLAWRDVVVEGYEPKPDAKFGPRPTPWQKVKTGDLLWVRENGAFSKPGGWQIYQADLVDPSGKGMVTKWTPSIHMPRWASRLTLEVTAVKIERLQEINADDAIAEGVHKRSRKAAYPWHVYAKEDFGHLWDSLHGTGAWASNPEVVAISFVAHRKNIDKMKQAA